jgi:hypothetical protein
LERNGRLHSLGRPFYRDHTPWETQTSSPSTNALQAPYAGVLARSYQSDSLRDIEFDTSRFYPGLSSPHFKAIGAGPQTAGSIHAPISETQEFDSPLSASHTKKYAVHGHRLTRPARVVGSLDHAVLPEPPVSLTSLADNNARSLRRLIVY